MTLRSVAVVLCASVALTAHVFEGSGLSAKAANGYAQDMAAIEKLHAQDIAATLSQDPGALAKLWTDDVVRLNPGQEAEVGKQTLLAAAERRRAAQPGFRVVSYVPEIK